MGLIWNSAGLKLNNEQKQRKLSEFSMGSGANGGIVRGFNWLLESVSRVQASEFEKKQRILRKNQDSQSQWGHWRFSMKKINRNCALRGSYAYLWDRNRQYDDR